MLLPLLIHCIWLVNCIIISLLFLCCTLFCTFQSLAFAGFSLNVVFALQIPVSVFLQHVICDLENPCFATITLNVAYTFRFPTPGVFTLYVACTLKFAFASFRLYVAPTLGNIFPASLIACDSCLSKSFFYCL